MLSVCQLYFSLDAGSCFEPRAVNVLFVHRLIGWVVVFVRFVSVSFLRSHVSVMLLPGGDLYEPVDVYLTVQVDGKQIVHCPLTPIIACRRGMSVQIWQALL